MAIKIDRANGQNYAENLVNDALSFNDGTWTVASGTGTVSLVSTVYFEGQSSMRIQNNVPASDLTVTNSTQTTSLDIDGDYQISLYIRKDIALEQRQVDVLIYQNAVLLDTQSCYIGSTDADLDINDEWVRFQTDEPYSLSKGDDITFQFTLKSSGTSELTTFVWVDALMLNLADRGNSIVPAYTPPLTGAPTVSNNYVEVNSLSDFPTPSAGVITLVDGYTYMVNGEVDLDGNRIDSNNASVNIFGRSSETSFLTSTGLSLSTPLITSNTTIKLGNITIKDVDTALSLTKSTVMAVDWDSVNFDTVPNIGTIDSPDNFIFTKGSLIDSNGLIFDGTIGTIGIDNSLLSGDGNAGNLIEIASTATITRRFRITYSAVVITGSTVGIDVDVSATIPDEAYILDTVNFSGGGTYLDGIDVTDNKTAFSNCVGIQNSAELSQYYMNNNATATTISATNTPVKVSGTTTSSSISQKFTNTDNRATYTGSRTRLFKVTSTLSVESGNNNQIGVYIAKNGSVSSESEVYGTTSGTGRAENIVVHTVLELSTNDYVEIYVENATAITNITVTDLNVVVF